MTESPTNTSPYAHMKCARQFESASDLRAAETQWKYAVRAADRLPLDEYRKNMRLENVRYKADPKYQSQPGVTEAAMRQSYSEVLALPFITRIEMAGFYARHGAYPEAQEFCQQAFNLVPDAVCLQDERVKQFYKRGMMVKQTLDEMIGPDELERLFEENFSKLDLDGNGFIHHGELERAQFDLSLSLECQLLIRHLLCHYFEVEAAHDDEWGIDIKGISIRDMKMYSELRNRGWKRMSKDQQTQPHTWHRW